MNRKKGAKPNERSELLYGIQPVLGALQHKKRHLDQLYLKKDAYSSERLTEIRKLAEQLRLPVSEVTVSKLTEISSDAVHQGVVLRCGFLPFASMHDLPQSAVGTHSLLVVLDQIKDPHNLGAIIRTCGFFEVNAVVVPQDHSSGLTPVVSKASAGVAEWLPVISVTNLARFLNEQKTKGFWVAGLEENAPHRFTDFSRDRPMILVLGNEGRGIRRLVRKHCDWLVCIPGNQEVPSLNVSNAVAVALYHLQTLPQTP